MSVNRDIFGYDRNGAVSGVFTTEGSVLQISGAGAAGATGEGTNITLVQGWNITYRQDVQDIYEVGSSKVYWAKGHPVGNGSINRVVSGDKNTVLIIPEAYDICKAPGITFSIIMKPGKCTDGSSSGAGAKLTMSGVVVTQIGFATTAGDVKFTESVDYRFARLDLDVVAA